MTVSLALRFVLAIALVAMASTATLGFALREAWRTAEERRFETVFREAVKRLGGAVNEEIRRVPAVLAPLCAHDPFIDHVLIELKAGRLDDHRRLAIQLRVPESMKGARLDELTLATASGEVLGAGHDSALIGTRDPTLARRLAAPMETASLRRQAPVAIESVCVRSLGSARVGLVGSIHLSTVLRNVGRSHGLALRLESEPGTEGEMTRSVELEELGELRVVAAQSRVPLARSLAALDATVVALGAATVLASLGLTWLIARRLARPIVALAEQARRVTHGEPEAVQGSGGRELVELAESFNHALADLAALRKRLAVTERIAARREIARRVAHEIKNPLMPIRTAVETLRRLRARGDPAFDGYFDEASRTVLDEVGRIAHIVQEFTEFARLPPPRPRPVDLAAAARDVVGLHAAGAVPVELVDAGLPTVNADREQVVQVLTNLVQNALDAVGERPGARVLVELARAGNDHVTLAVRDNGPGVDAQLRARLFQPYATTKEHGTGLGLAIAQRMAVEHGGEIAYRDAEGGGAEFVVTLPVAGPLFQPDAPPPSG